MPPGDAQRLYAEGVALHKQGRVAEAADAYARACASLRGGRPDFFHIVDEPPGCPGFPTGGQLAPNRFSITVSIDPTVPATRYPCDFIADFGMLAQGRYTAGVTRSRGG